ncbi:hypothetical protein [Bacillus cereus]
MQLTLNPQHIATIEEFSIRRQKYVPSIFRMEINNERLNEEHP